MTPQEHLAFADKALREIREALATALPCPKTRELRARASTFERAMMTFTGRVPSKEQTSALLDGVRELHARVFESTRRTRSQMTTTPVVRVNVTNPRVVLPAARPSQRPTVKPPPVASRPPGARSIPPATLPPPSSSGRR